MQEKIIQISDDGVYALTSEGRIFMRDPLDAKAWVEMPLPYLSDKP